MYEASKKLKIIECPRDAMQGWPVFIPTEKKIAYINLLLQVGFDTLDFGSFVSPKAVPQMSDTVDVLKKLRIEGSSSKLLAIVVNLRGIEQAAELDKISYLGYPFSISETFQKRNANAGIRDSLKTIEGLMDIVNRRNKEAVIYLSMAFGNPYGDDWSEEIAESWTSELIKRGVKTIALSDTIGIAGPGSISSLYRSLSEKFSGAEFGLHLHSRPDSEKEKIEGAYLSGCRRFDSALRGLGGCPMARDELTGNIATESLIQVLQNHHENMHLNLENLQEALSFSRQVFL